eukprot:m.136939 g.136939  ORF g.136939 m.136939 type:complete len:1111 (-) comp11081_c0_seq1:147-3479(-)
MEQFGNDGVDTAPSFKPTMETNLDGDDIVREKTKDDPIFVPLEKKAHHDIVLKSGEKTWVAKKVLSYNFKEIVKFKDDDFLDIDGNQFKLLFFPKGDGVRGSVALFVECTPPLHEKVFAECIITISGKKKGHEVTRLMHHCFKTNYTNKGWNALGSLDTYKKYGLMKNGDVKIKVKINLLQGRDRSLFFRDANFDSKRDTGMVGIENQGATCYMNSLLQAFYHTKELRKAVYMMPTQSDDAETGVALALQRVFFRLETKDDAISTTELTRSFGWTGADSFLQHDVQEFSRVLMDNLEEKMKNTPSDGTIKSLFCGKTKSYIRGINVEFESSRIEEYYDIQLNVKGIPNVMDSFRDYVKEEILDGDNQYHSDDHGMQDAKKGVIFESFPPVLHLQLKRFEYSFEYDDYRKVNDRFEFQETLDLSEFLSDPKSAPPSTFSLQAVLVHSGTTQGGHYIAYIRPDAQTQWYLFDDEAVELKFKQEALEANFGSTGRYGVSNAYMLVYIRDDMIDTYVNSKVKVPQDLVERFEKEELFAQRENDCYKFKLYTKEYLDSHFDAHCFKIGVGLGSIERRFWQESISDWLKELAKDRDLKVENVRLWPILSKKPMFVDRTALCTANKNTHLTWEKVLEENGYKPAKKFEKGFCRFFLEEYTDESRKMEEELCGKVFEAKKEAHSEEPYDLRLVEDDHPKLFFMKIFDLQNGTLAHVARIRAIETTQLGAIVDVLKRYRLAAFPLYIENSHVKMYFEKSFESSKIDIPELDLIKTVGDYDIPHGSVLVLEVHPTSDEGQFQYESVLEWYDKRGDMISVRGDDLDCKLEKKTFNLPASSSHDEIQRGIAQALGIPLENYKRIQLFMEYPHFRDYKEIKSSTHMTLRDILETSSKVIKPLKFKLLDKPVSEFEQEVELQVKYVDPKTHGIEDASFEINRDAAFEDVLKEVFSIGKFSEEDQQHIRIVNGSGHKAVLFQLKPTASELSIRRWAIRVEVIPEDQRELADDERIIEIRHFHYYSQYPHSDPVFAKIKDGDTVAEFKERLKKNLKVHDRDYSTWKLHLCKDEPYSYYGSSTPAKELQDDDKLLLSDILKRNCFLAFKHVNKGKRVYADAAVKIHN